MRIALIGTGRLGATLAGHLVDVGHFVTLVSGREPHGLSGLLRLLAPLGSADNPSAAAERADIVILTASFDPAYALAGGPAAEAVDRAVAGAVDRPAVGVGDGTASGLAGGPTGVGRRLVPVQGGTLGPLAGADDQPPDDQPHGGSGVLPPPETVIGKVVIDAMNAPDGLDLGGRSSTEWIAARLPGARVVKAFNAIDWRELRDDADRRPPRAVPLCGDDPGGKDAVADLIRQIGFAPVDTGSLATGSLLIEPGGPLYGRNLTADDARAELAAV